MTSVRIGVVGVLAAMIAVPAFAITVKPPVPLPDGLSAEQVQELQWEYDLNVRRFNSLQRRMAEHAAACPKVVTTAAKKQECDDETFEIEHDARFYNASYEIYMEKLRPAGVLLVAQASQFDKDSMARLAKAIKDSVVETDAQGNRTEIATGGSDKEIQETWSAIRNRAKAGQASLAAAAAAGQGPPIVWSGTQATGHNDCTIYALSTATGRPYSLVAAMAGNVIEGAVWRQGNERTDAEGIITREGLLGHEVKLMAEGYGEVHLVYHKNFAAELQAGRPIMLGVHSPSTLDTTKTPYLNAHEIVLSRTFQHMGPDNKRVETWFEIVDSNLGQMERYYATAKELGLIGPENGVVYMPDPKTVAPLQKAPGSN